MTNIFRPNIAAALACCVWVGACGGIADDFEDLGKALGDGLAAGAACAFVGGCKPSGEQPLSRLNVSASLVSLDQESVEACADINAGGGLGPDTYLTGTDRMEVSVGSQRVPLVDTNGGLKVAFRGCAALGRPSTSAYEVRFVRDNLTYASQLQLPSALVLTASALLPTQVVGSQPDFTVPYTLTLPLDADVTHSAAVSARCTFSDGSTQGFHDFPVIVPSEGGVRQVQIRPAALRQSARRAVSASAPANTLPVDCEAYLLLRNQRRGAFDPALGRDSRFTAMSDTKWSFRFRPEQ